MIKRATGLLQQASTIPFSNSNVISPDLPKRDQLHLRDALRYIREEQEEPAVPLATTSEAETSARSPIQCDHHEYVRRLASDPATHANNRDGTLLVVSGSKSKCRRCMAEIGCMHWAMLEMRSSGQTDGDFETKWQSIFIDSARHYSCRLCGAQAPLQISHNQTIGADVASLPYSLRNEMDSVVMQAHMVSKATYFLFRLPFPNSMRTNNMSISQFFTYCLWECGYELHSLNTQEDIHLLFAAAACIFLVYMSHWHSDMFTQEETLALSAIREKKLPGGLETAIHAALELMMNARAINDNDVRRISTEISSSLPAIREFIMNQSLADKVANIRDVIQLLVLNPPKTPNTWRNNLYSADTILPIELVSIPLESDDEDESGLDQLYGHDGHEHVLWEDKCSTCNQTPSAASSLPHRKYLRAISLLHFMQSVCARARTHIFLDNICMHCKFDRQTKIEDILKDPRMEERVSLSTLEPVVLPEEIDAEPDPPETTDLQSFSEKTAADRKRFAKQECRDLVVFLEGHLGNAAEGAAAWIGSQIYQYCWLMIGAQSRAKLIPDNIAQNCIVFLRGIRLVYLAKMRWDIATIVVRLLTFVPAQTNATHKEVMEMVTNPKAFINPVYNCNAMAYLSINIYWVVYSITHNMPGITEEGNEVQSVEEDDTVVEAAATEETETVEEEEQDSGGEEIVALEKAEMD